MSLKGNQKHLFEDVRDVFTEKYKRHRHETLGKAHGRIEKRIYTSLDSSEVFDNEEYGQWASLRSLVEVERRVETLDDELRSESSIILAVYLMRLVRS